MGRKEAEKMGFQELTWADLQAWASSRVVSRGRDYQRRGKVQDLHRTRGGGLVAYVQGEKSYITLVKLGKGGLESQCTCPYSVSCKHAVAVVLEYLEQGKKGANVPTAEENDRRFLALHLHRSRAQGRWAHEGKEDDWDEDEWDDGQETEDEAYEEVSQPASRRPARTTGSNLKAFLEGQTKAQLVALIQDLAQRHPEIQEALQDRRDLSQGSVARMVAAVRKEIDALSAEPAWRNHWDGRGHIPDYSRVRERMKALLEQGHADEVLDLGKELLEAGIRQIEMSHDDGELGDEISSCLAVAFDALNESSLNGADRILWAVEADLADDYDLCKGSESFWETEHGPQDWGRVTDALLPRLEEMPVNRGEDSFSKSYRRDALSKWIITALENAHRHDEIIPLCEQEAPVTASYERLVRCLLDAHRSREAEAWIAKGIEATQSKLPGIADGLREIWRGMREKEGRWLSVAALHAEEFLARPGFSTYSDLRKAARKAKVWKDAQGAVFHFLETGVPPGKGSSWPFPPSGLPTVQADRNSSFPDVRTLLEISIAEKRPEEVLRWYDSPKPGRFGWRWGPNDEDRIAGAVTGHHPQKAIEIWKRLAEREIGLTQPKAYEQAGRYLRKVRGLMEQLGREEEWKGYLRHLREANARKKRLLEVLDGLSGRRIVEGP